MEDGVDSQACGCGFVLMASDYHNNQSSGSLSEHQPVQRLQNLQFNFVQDYGEVIVLVTIVCYVGVAS